MFLLAVPNGLKYAWIAHFIGISRPTLIPPIDTAASDWPGKMLSPTILSLEQGRRSGSKRFVCRYPPTHPCRRLVNLWKVMGSLSWPNLRIPKTRYNGICSSQHFSAHFSFLLRSFGFFWKGPTIVSSKYVYLEWLLSDFPEHGFYPIQERWREKYCFQNSQGWSFTNWWWRPSRCFTASIPPAYTMNAPQQSSGRRGLKCFWKGWIRHQLVHFPS